MMVKNNREHNDIDLRLQQLRAYVDEQVALLRQEFTQDYTGSDERLRQIELKLSWLGGFLKGAGLTDQLETLNLSERD